MKVEFANKIETLGDMKDGDMAITLKGNHLDGFLLGPINPYGLLVQRYRNALILIGKGAGAAYPMMFSGGRVADIPVRILKAGDTIVIE